MEWSTIAGVTEVVDTYREGFSSNGATGNVTLQCNWDDRYAVRDDLILTSRIWPYADPNSILGLRATSADITPHSCIGNVTPGSPQLQNYQFAQLAVGYQPAQASDPNNLLQPFTAFTETITPSVDWRRLDHNLFRFVSGGQVSPVFRDEAPAVPLGRLAFERTYFNWSGPAPPEFLDAVNTTNSDAVTSQLLGRTFDPGTLIYQPGSANQTVSSDGSQSATLSVRFLYKREGWNRWYNARVGDYAEIFVFDGTQPVTNWARYQPFTPTSYAGLF